MWEWDGSQMCHGERIFKKKKIAHQQKESVIWGLEQKLRIVVVTCGSVF
jgi:hypothetical protein